MDEVIEPQRLYVIVDSTVPASTAAPQGIHAVTEFALADPEAYKEWRDNGNYCIVLEASPRSMATLLLTLTVSGFQAHAFFEPDWNVSTPSAIVFKPDPRLRELLSHLSLARPRGYWGERKRARELAKRWARET